MIYLYQGDPLFDKNTRIQAIVMTIEFGMNMRHHGHSTEPLFIVCKEVRGFPLAKRKKVAERLLDRQKRDRVIHSWRKIKCTAKA